MKRLVTAVQMRAIEAASAEAGVPPSELMESAGRKLAEAAARLCSPNGQIIVVCGTGNNGGDGLVAARFLANSKRRVHVELVGDPAKLKADPARNLKALAASGVQPRTLPDNHQVGAGDVIVDALFGTGLTRVPEGPFADAIRRINVWRAGGAKVVAADLPSGLHTDTGQGFSPVVRADLTVTFGFYKSGQAVEPGASLCGELELAEIGIPASCALAAPGGNAWLLEEEDVRARIPERKRDTHKGTYGHVLVVAGSWGKTGAAALTAKAVLRSGAGLCTLATRPEALVPAMAHAPEIMGVELVSDGGLSRSDLNSILEAADGKQALVLGPGMARGEETGKLLGALFEELEVPMVLDADALNAVAEDVSILKKARGPLVLTPHPGEMARLTGMSTAAVQESRIDLAREFAKEHGVTVVLKGARTIICAQDGAAYVNPTGNPGMATGGTGDVLSGVIGGLIAQGIPANNAAIAGVFAHGLAGDLAAKKHGMMGLMASDVLAGLGDVWGAMEPLKPTLERVFQTRSPEETQALGRRLGAILEAGDFVGLVGDLGAGKTRFVRGVAEGAEVPPSEVASPTFAIVYPYEGKRVRLHHADLYRLADPDELYATGFFDLIGAGDSALLVEWIEKIPNAVPEDALLLHFRAPNVDDDDLREITARAFGPRSAARLSAWL